MLLNPNSGQVSSSYLQQQTLFDEHNRPLQNSSTFLEVEGGFAQVPSEEKLFNKSVKKSYTTAKTIKKQWK